MTNRGRPPKDSSDRKDTQISVRISSALRGQLEEARRDTDVERSLSQEIELRLRQSFEQDQKIEEQFHGKTNYWLLKNIADGMRYINQQSQTEWFSDRWTFDQVKSLVVTMFDFFKPKGRSKLPVHFPAGFDYSKLGREQAMRSLMMIELELRGLIEDGGAPYGEVARRAAAAPLGSKMKKSAFSELTGKSVPSTVTKKWEKL